MESHTPRPQFVDSPAGDTERLPYWYYTGAVRALVDQYREGLPFQLLRADESDFVYDLLQERAIDPDSDFTAEQAHEVWQDYCTKYLNEA